MNTCKAGSHNSDTCQNYVCCNMFAIEITISVHIIIPHRVLDVGRLEGSEDYGKKLLVPSQT